MLIGQHKLTLPLPIICQPPFTFTVTAQSINTVCAIRIFSRSSACLKDSNSACFSGMYALYLTPRICSHQSPRFGCLFFQLHKV
ncbi:hypothetical protein NC653_000997 [Populus alba x Populus x berolinensis]|uniref:Uncharacterized protein n=1 Tax=Populus alba x Populus x berolinensis TaxID=444605 RepID=A0AAD6RKB5_9ROSI|nr:hypothetical protein NC653_000997 [Populus alba x Populus x berolinensis]